MAASDALTHPKRATAFRATFEIRDASNNLVTGATGLDSEVSKDGGSFTDCTNEATEIGSTGIYYLDITSSEFTADQVVVQVKSSGKTVVLIYNLGGNIDVNVTKYGGSNGTFSSGRPEVNTTHWAGTAVGSTTVRADIINIAGAAVSASTAQLGVNVVNAGGTAWGSGAITAGALAADCITAAKIADGAIDAGSIATGAITSAKFAADAIDAAAIANGAIDAATFAADVDAEILSYLVDDATRIDASALNTLSGHDPGETIMGATDLGTGDGLTALATAANLATVAGYLDTEIAAILEDTGTTIPAQISALNNISASDVWAAGSRTLTAGTNIQLPSNGLANITTWTVAITGNITGNLSGSVGSLTSDERDAIAAALLDLANGVETSYSVRQAFRLVLAALAGKLSGAAGTDIAIRDVNDTKDRIQATVDAVGNRSAVTLDVS